jgi:hypothetical protein
MPLRCKGNMMIEFRSCRIFLSLLPAVILGTVLASESASATDLIILREVPPHNAIEPIPPNSPTVTVQVEQGDLIQSLLSGPRLDDDDIGAVLASPPGGTLRGGMPAVNDAVNVLDGSRDALSNVPNSGMGSFSSLNGLGGEISGQVNGAVQSGLQGLNSALGAVTGGQ